MKKLILTLVVVLTTLGLSQAQEGGAKLAKSAGKALTSYNIDPSGNSAKLGEAKEKIEQALKFEDARALPDAWLTKGDVYNTMLQKDLDRRMIDKEAPLTGDNDALEAFNAYKEAYKLATKKYHKTDAVKGIAEVQAQLINVGVAKYEKEEYEKAFLSFKASLESHEILTENKKTSALDDPTQLKDQKYFTGLIATMADRCADAVVYYTELYKEGTDNASVYEGLYNCKMKMGDEAGANTVLTEGRKKFPNDPALLFAEINAYLKAGKLADLIGRLKQAIKQEPDNVSLYVTLGNVYDNLYTTAIKDNDTAKADEYFNEAKASYEAALARDSTHVDANYSLGALYYNKAAAKTQEMNELPEDFSSAGIAKLNKMRGEVMALFDLALPSFKAAERANPDDVNTLIALNEIFARKDDLETATEFKKRLQTVKDGGKNATPYFKQ